MSIPSIIKQSILAHFKVSPPPASLTQSYGIFRSLKSLSSPDHVIYYKQEQCPVTHMYLNNLRMILHDEDFAIETPPSTDSKTINTLVDNGVLMDQQRTLSTLEKRLLELFPSHSLTTDGTEFKLELVNLTRDKDVLSKYRDNSLVPDELKGEPGEKIKFSKDDSERLLSGFSGLFI